eukprot:gene11191-19379_t
MGVRSQQQKEEDGHSEGVASVDRVHSHCEEQMQAAAAATPTIAIIGRGVLGAATSFHLTKLGARVVCIDGGPLGGSATARSAGLLLHASSPSKASSTAQTLRDIAEMDAVQAKLGSAGEGPVGFVKTGMVRVASDQDELDRLKLEMAMVSRGGYSAVRWLETTRQASSAVPWLRLPHCATACIVEQDGIVDPVVLAGRYWRAARDAGAVHVPHDAAALASTAASKTAAATTRVVSGVVLAGTGQEIRCDYCIDATGSWAGSLAEEAFGTPPLPMAATRSHYWTAKALPHLFPVESAMVLIPAAGWYSRPTHTAGDSIIGLQEEVSPTWSRADLDSPAHQAATLFIDGVGRLEPYVLPELLETLTLPHYTAGLTSYTPDGEYLLGTLGGSNGVSECASASITATTPSMHTTAVEGYSVLSGCNGSGLSSAGGLGLLAAKEALQSLVAQGNVDVDGLDHSVIAMSRAEQAALSAWSVQRPSVHFNDQPAVGTHGYRQICSAARASKFGTANSS